MISGPILSMCYDSGDGFPVNVSRPIYLSSCQKVGCDLVDKVVTFECKDHVFGSFHRRPTTPLGNLSLATISFHKNDTHWCFIIKK